MAIGSRVVGGDVIQGQVDAVALPDQIASPCHDGQGGQPQEVNLEHPQFVHHAHLELGHRLYGGCFCCAGWAVQRHIVHQRSVSDHHPGGMGAGIAHHAFHIGGGVDQVFEVVFRFVQLLELRDVFQRAPDGHQLAGDVGDQLGHPVHLAQGDVLYPSHVADGGACSQRAEGDDLRHPVGAVLLGGILEHLRAAVIAEVKVDIRHVDAPRVEEALEDQAILERLDQGDIQAECHHRAVAGAAHVVPDALVAGVAAQIPHDEEVGVEAHLVDHLQLVVQALADNRLFRPFAVAPDEARLAQLAQVALRSIAIRYLEMGQVIALETQVELAALVDQQGVGDGFGRLGEERRHLLRAAQVVRVVGHAHAPRVG